MRLFAAASTAAVLASVLVTAVHGQDRPAPAPDPARDAHRTITLIGCLEASASLPGFRLKNVEQGSPEADAGTAVGTSGKPVVYEVSAREGLDLAAFAGQKVSVTAVPEEKVEPEPAPAPGSTGLEGPLPKITVATVKTLAGSC
ncbi:MAG: hypothetical protein AB7P99_13625 [Vicinamibacterales bacterium]